MKLVGLFMIRGNGFDCFEFDFNVGRWRKQQRSKAKEGRGCNSSPEGFIGGSL